MNELTPIEERAKEHERHCIQEAKTEGLCCVRSVLVATIASLQSCVRQLGDYEDTQTAVTRYAGRELAEMLVESLANELPVNPSDLIDSVDPDDMIQNTEFAVDAVKNEILSTLKGFRYE